MIGKLAILATAALALAWSHACGSAAPGTVRVELTDAPTLEFDHVYVHVRSVLAHVNANADDPDRDDKRAPLAADNNATAPVDGDKITEDARRSGWVVLAEPDARFDLLALRNDAYALLGTGEVPSGDYKLLRLVLSAASVVTGDSTYTLMVPSGETSGLKINEKFTVEAGQEHILRLDFDAEQSIHLTGNGRYMLKPVLKVKKYD